MRFYQHKDSFRSFLGLKIWEYLQVKSALHYNIDSIGYVLAHFDLYLRTHHIHMLHQLNPAFFLEWIDEQASEWLPETVIDKVCIVKGFFDHLVRFESLECNPLEQLPSIKPFQYVPYVYSRSQIKNILEIAYAQIFEDKNYFFARWAHYAIIYTIYACGLRISECLRLKGEDIRWEDRTLFIRETKFGKNRIIPFHKMLERVLKDYCCVRQKRFPSVSGWFFLSCKNFRYHRNSISTCFQGLLQKAGIPQGRRLEGNVVYGGPTIHSLRHSFAVHRLMRWYEQGCNPQDKLHLLATYMGHYNYEYTHHYLRLCPPLRKLAGGRFAKHYDTLSWQKGEEDEG